MAEFDDSFLQFDSSKLDVNENPSTTENHLLTDIAHETVPSKIDETSKPNLTFCEILQSSENPENYVKRPEISNEISKVDLHFQTVDENSSPFNETLYFSIAPNISSERPESSNEINKVDLLLQTVDESSSPFNETSYFSIAPNISNEMPEITNEILTNDLALPSNKKEENIDNRTSDSGIHDSENNIIESTNMIDFNVIDLNISNDCTDMLTEFTNEGNDVQVKDEEFHDAVQFFKDPLSFTFLENAGSTNAPAESLMTRSSLYVNFDPLHAKFYSQPVTSEELDGIVEDDTDPEVQSDGIKDINVPFVNKHVANINSRESLGNVLISFDSPINIKNTNSQTVDKKPAEPQKLYTEEELQQALKIQELSLQEVFLKRQQDLELARSQKQQELETKISELSSHLRLFYSFSKEIIDITKELSEKKNELQEKLKLAEMENNKLKEDLKTSVEDLQSVESTFSDFHKRYEQCKNLLKVYTQNEDNFKQMLENLKVQLQEKDEMYKVLQSRTEEMLNKANTEVANAKKTGDAHVAVLTAQLKKAELKISSLESDVKHVKIENSKLSNICDDLMAKVSEG